MIEYFIFIVSFDSYVIDLENNQKTNEILLLSQHNFT